jgi:hypothetical protein
VHLITRTAMTTSLAPAETSFLLWALGGLVYVLGLHVGLAAVRAARRTAALRAQQGLVLMAGLAWGTVLCFGFLLGVAGLALPYSLGFQVLAGPALWLGTCLLACLGAWWLVRRPGNLENAGVGAAFGVLALTVQAGWLASAGLRPGLAWRPEILAGAALLMALGLGAAWRVGLGQEATLARLRWRWRVAAAVLGTVALLAGQEVLVAGMGLSAQVSSMHRHPLSISLISLLGGAVVPIVLAVAALDLHHARRASRRIHHRDFATLGSRREEVAPRRRKFRFLGR